MKIISINLGVEREIQTANSNTKTGIYKLPVQGAVHVSGPGLDGDVIYSKKNHGGPDQAVYIYGAADTEWWEKELGKEIAPGTFGENLTIGGLESASFHVGDFLHIGDVTLQVTSPRIPCGTFASRMEDSAWVKKFRQAERPGFYCRVMREGFVKAGEAVSLENSKGRRSPSCNSIAIIMKRIKPRKCSAAISKRPLPSAGAEGWRRS